MYLNKAMFLVALALGGLLSAEDLAQQTRTQLVTARSQNTEDAYLKIERSLDAAVKEEPKNPLNLLYRGAVKMERAGWLARQTRFGPANEVMAAACADMDSAVAMGPENLEVRMTRGLMYSRFPSFLNKGPLAIQDLEAAQRTPKFADLPADKRAEVITVLSTVRPPAGDQRPDRFPQIAAGTPVIAVASITMPHRTEETSPYIRELLKNLKTQQGLTGTHVLRSVDRPGMLVIMTWWKDKQALNDWFYGDVHQGVIRELYVDRKTNGGDASQVAIELLAPLPGGMRFGGGLAPESVK